MKQVEFQLEPLTCPTCVKKIEGSLGKIKGVEDSRVLFNSSKIKFNLDEEQAEVKQVRNVIEKLGYGVLSDKIK